MLFRGEVGGKVFLSVEIGIYALHVIHIVKKKCHVTSTGRELSYNCIQTILFANFHCWRRHLNVL